MTSLLDRPVLTLAIDNLSKLNSIDEKQLSTIWNLFTKVKDNLENGRRLENISWRLWYRSCHDRRDQLALPELYPSNKFDEVIQDLSVKTVRKPVKFFISEDEKSSTFTESVVGPPSMKKKKKRTRKAKKPAVQSVAEIPSEPSDSVSETSDFSSCSGDSFSDYSSYGESWSYSPSPLFTKMKQNQKQPRKSLLTDEVKLISNPQNEERDYLDAELTNSLKEGLIWDRCMPFNTTIRRKQMMQAWQQIEPEDIW